MKTVKTKGKHVAHMLITVEKRSIPSLRDRLLHKFIVKLDSCYAVVYAENTHQAKAVVEKAFSTRIINSIELA